MCAVDLVTGTWARHRADEPYPAASMIKVLVAEAFLRQVSEGTLGLDERYALKQADIVGGAGSLAGRGAGAEVSGRELLHAMIAESDNVAANALIDLVGMDAVNAEADRLGLARTELRRHMMDAEAAARGLENLTCADDLALLFTSVHDGTFVSAEMSALMHDCLADQEDDAGILAGLPAGTPFAHKTGALPAVLHDGGIVEGERPFVLVVLCGGEGFSEDEALALMARVGRTAYEDASPTRP